MDTWLLMIGLTTFFFAYLGEKFRADVYIWLATIFAIIFALRMAEPMFYMATAGVIGVFVYRTWFADDDIRDAEVEKKD